MLIVGLSGFNLHRKRKTENKKLILGLALFILGLLGILTMLTIKIPLDSIPKEVLEKIS